MALRESIAVTPPPHEVLAALDGIVSSDVFRGSPQLAEFLRFVVAATLAGKSDRIKGYTIGVEALKRGKEFDPQIDPIVRVEATRLRRAMERYYATEGAASPVRIDIARGTYAPRFSYSRDGNGRTIVPEPPAAAAAWSGNGMPTLLVQRFKILSPPGTNSISASNLHESLCDAFARFDTVNITSTPGDPEDTSINYRLVGSIEYRGDETAYVRSRLIDAADGTVAWSRVFEKLPSTGGPAVAEDAVVTELAVTLAQPFGVIRALERVRHLRGGGDPRYRAIVEASESFRSFDREQHRRARESLEKLVKSDPGFSSGFAYLAAIYFRGYQYGYGGQRDDPLILDRALEMARKAIELKPESARAYQILFGVLFVRRDMAAAFAAGDRAMALNRYDTTIQSDNGGRLVMIGEIARGMEMLQRAGEFGTIRPSWHHFYMFLGSYLSRDLINTIHHAGLITADDYTLGLVARALAAKTAGDPSRAARAIERLEALAPAWAADPRGELARFFPVPELADRLASDLARAGLPGIAAAQ
jgi:tetratricopeptide (TPR) repeat protein